jgi:hypothetical protein
MNNEEFYIDMRKKEALEKAKEYEVLLNLIQGDYPDIKRYRDRDTIRFCSTKINNKVNNVEIEHGSRLYSDDPLYVWTSIIIDGVRVYSNPPNFYIGEEDRGGDSPIIGWQEKLRKASIPDTIILKIEDYFEKNKPEGDEEDYD